MKRLILGLFGIILIAYCFYNFGANRRNSELLDERTIYQQEIREREQKIQQLQQKQEAEKYIEEAVNLPGGIVISLLVNRYTDKVEYWWHPSGWQPIAKSTLNLQWAYDNRRTLRMLPNSRE